MRLHDAGFTLPSPAADLESIDTFNDAVRAYEQEHDFKNTGVYTYNENPRLDKDRRVWRERRFSQSAKAKPKAKNFAQRDPSTLPDRRITSMFKKAVVVDDEEEDEDDVFFSAEEELAPGELSDDEEETCGDIGLGLPPPTPGTRHDESTC